MEGNFISMESLSYHCGCGYYVGSKNSSSNFGLIIKQNPYLFFNNSWIRKNFIIGSSKRKMATSSSRGKKKLHVLKLETMVQIFISF
jgi:hypothetical protein